MRKERIDNAVLQAIGGDVLQPALIVHGEGLDEPANVSLEVRELRAHPVESPTREPPAYVMFSKPFDPPSA